MASATLDAIRTKVRRLTRSPSISQITDLQLDEYINTFILYDFPQNLRLFSLRTTLTFYTQPNIDVYETNATVTTDPLYNFKNRCISVHPPIYIAGIPASYTQKRNLFYGCWPQTNAVVDTLLRGKNPAITGPFTGTIRTIPMLQNSVNFNALDVNGNSMVLVDYPVYTGGVRSTTTGDLGLPNQAPVSPSPFGQINYVTGVYTVTFPNNVKTNAPIYVEYVPYAAGKPISILFYDSKFTLRPVPDKTYTVQVEVDIRPTELLLATDIPQIEQWWQYIAYGAAKKIFEDRMDMDSVQMIMHEYKNQELLVQRATIMQMTNERTTTIFSIGKVYGSNWFRNSWPY